MDHGYAIDCTVLVIVDQLDSGSYCLAPCPGGNPRQQNNIDSDHDDVPLATVVVAAQSHKPAAPTRSVPSPVHMEEPNLVEITVRTLAL